MIHTPNILKMLLGRTSRINMNTGWAVDRKKCFSVNLGELATPVVPKSVEPRYNLGKPPLGLY